VPWCETIGEVRHGRRAHLAAHLLALAARRDALLHDLGVVLGVRPALLQLAEAVVGRLVADLGAVAEGLDGLVVLVRVVGPGAAWHSLDFADHVGIVAPDLANRT
jgi:hypothetical protein